MKSKEEAKQKETDFIFFAPHIQQTNQLPEQESRHCTKVLRKNAGDKIVVADGKGTIYNCIIIAAHHKHTTVSIESKIETPKNWHFNLHLAFAPTKNMDRNEWFVEKATEIGIDNISPLHCSYSERKDVRLDRLEKVAVAAMKQSKQAVMPVISEMTSFDTFIETPFEGQKFIAHCYNNEKNPLSHAYNKGQNALILIGPEGDFSEEEIEKAIRHGFIPISLGENRLRTETACLVACHTIHVLNQ